MVYHKILIEHNIRNILKALYNQNSLGQFSVYENCKNLILFNVYSFL